MIARTRQFNVMAKAAPFVVALMGARMHYAVPRLLHESNSLSRFYADICATHGWPSLLRAAPKAFLPVNLRRLMERQPTGIPRAAITSFTNFGLEYSRRRSRARSVSDMTA